MARADGQALLRSGTPAGRWTLAAMVLGSGVVSIDATVVNVALPQIAGELDANFAGLQWIVTSYTLTLAALILAAGALADRYGRRRVFCVGLVWFAVASAICAAAPNIGVLIGARALQGVGGALLTPGSLAIVSAAFHPDDRARAVGAWSGLSGVAVAVGPFLGGWLVGISWRWIFVINLPLVAVVLLLTVRHVPESRDPDAAAHFDLAGVALGALGLAGTTYALTERHWWIGLGGLLVLAAFVLVERRSRAPMLPVGIFANPVFRATNLLTLVVYAALGMVLFMLILVLQSALGYSPLAAGAAIFPATLLMLAFSAASGALAGRIGPRLPLTLGPLMVAGGLLLFLRVEVDSSYLTGVLPAVLGLGAGLALMVAPLTATVLAAADDRHAGMASGVNNAVARAAGLLGVAGLPLLAGMDPTGTEMSGADLLAGFHQAMLVAAVLCAAGGALAFVTLGRRPALPGLAEPTGERPCFNCGLNTPPPVVHATSAHR